MNEQAIPEPLQQAIDDFFVWWIDKKDHEKTIDNITQDALNHMKETDGNSAGEYFFFMRGLKEFLNKLKPYAK